ncbi:bifunctional diaminohydroxyphosphoribosylaminopyrimidine deaminase/5-amino-6-(5-phosphoribosylamino)uracil reductase RibD [Aliiglaciecola sp. LCG003]|uniref:bifunctional diaminohydroxyphosphoribosylaminopyrimidine deaminase/5-amino-6-(5-phosphoribosylamino)uracil reductase RibD n=1 Tax=Aliiglaciecola sp. LCG003 TaxID=3053655 RepID=UPI0025725810|nr:bifunctional diaminohydroxyphosphoribosylaminopyrimidine deaminase/5-amino-6-(5-phosphoribosylamino)uracil reductase RibD [Aliiglaciecola sp. LCG003]WJG08420.1 bifunctional diaminohydroxyphosphoribosylaminopyrimidine deaminase/5-amino-6-(5-phosphoribosylamino)uracil reductase RibD [Aliiglaciecola sp. LCG003]
MTVQTFSAQDHRMMAQALKLAQRGIYSTSPNPNVGCVIADDSDNIVGQGWHLKAGSPHAEVHALRQAGRLAKGATAYVTLEPCSHFGRTPPCANALVEAGIKRVVAAMVDPNPAVSGRGLAILQQQGIDTSYGLMAEQAETLNRGFVKRMKTGTPWVTLKLAASLDGKTALANGRSQWITGTAARQDVQRHRLASCAILSGSGTVLTDDPSLNVRHHELGDLAQQIDKSTMRQPARIILDGRNQLHNALRLFDLAGQTYVFNQTYNSLLRPSVEQIQLASKDNKLDLQAVLQNLAELQFNNIWLEAGGRLAGALVQQNLVDELILYQAPKLLGDKSQNLFVMDELTSMSQTKMLQWSSIKMVGEDVKFTARFVPNSE